MEPRLITEFSLLAGYLAEDGSIPDAEKYRADFPALLAFARRFKAYVELAGRGREKMVLDIGCSLGHGTRLLAEEARAVAGLDAGERPLQEASRQKAGDRIIYTRGDARCLPFPAGSFDLVAAGHLIEHLRPEELSAFLREVRRVTDTNGTVCFVTPNRRFRLRPFQPPFNPEHRREYTARALRRELAPVFSDIEIFGLRGRPWIEAIERTRVRRSPFRVYLADPLARRWRHRRPRWSRRGRAAKGAATGGRRPFSLDDFYLDGRYPERGIDLVAVCRKARPPRSGAEPITREITG